MVSEELVSQHEQYARLVQSYSKLSTYDDDAVKNRLAEFYVRASIVIRERGHC